MKEGDIIQITDEKHHWFPVLLVVTEIKSWGVTAYATIPVNDPDVPNGAAYIRVPHEQYEKVGAAVVAAAEGAAP